MSLQSPRLALLLLLLVSLIWGAEFVLIDQAVELLPTHSFNALRFLIAALALLPLLYWNAEPLGRHQWRPLLVAGGLLGFLLFIGFYAQTEGLLYTSVSNAGFITGLNVPLVPLLALLLLGTRAGANIWLGVAAATAGLYLLTVGDKLAFNRGDALVLVCAFAFALHILLTGRVAQHLPLIPLSIVQLGAVSAYSTLAHVVSGEPLVYPDAAGISSWLQLFNPIILSALLVAGVLGSGFAYWAQSAGQRLLPSYKVALVFATEPLFAHLFAWVFADETLGTLGIIGALLIVAGMLISELGERSRPLAVQPLDRSVATD
ncbi:MAG TPA: DMT family transporter [Motiliproteus sp.]